MDYIVVVVRHIAEGCRKVLAAPEVRLGVDIHPHRLCRRKSCEAGRPDFEPPYVIRRAACQQYSQAYILFCLQPCRSLLRDTVCHPQDRSSVSFAHSWRLVLLAALKGRFETVMLGILDIDCTDLFGGDRSGERPW